MLDRSIGSWKCKDLQKLSKFLWNNYMGDTKVTLPNRLFIIVIKFDKKNLFIYSCKEPQTNVPSIYKKRKLIKKKKKEPDYNGIYMCVCVFNFLDQFYTFVFLFFLFSKINNSTYANMHMHMFLLLHQTMYFDFICFFFNPWFHMLITIIFPM